MFIIICLILSANFAHCSEKSKSEKSKKEEKAAIAKLPSGVTYEIKGQHFGKNILSYMHAKWLAYINKVPLLFKPFPHSNHLILYTHEKKLNESLEWNEIIDVANENDVVYMDTNKNLYVVPFFSECDKGQEAPLSPYFAVDWEDKEFMKDIREMVSPTSGFSPLKLPKGRITVAVHVRKGLPSESQEEIEANPLKYPPDQFYINQIRRLYNTFKGHPMYVFIFTDHKNPAKIAKTFQEVLKNPNITFDWRKNSQNHKMNAVDDFFNMIKFKCLVRPESNFSIAAELIGNFSIIIKPTHSRYVKWRKQTIIDEVDIKVR